MFCGAAPALSAVSAHLVRPAEQITEVDGHWMNVVPEEECVVIGPLAAHILHIKNSTVGRVNKKVAKFFFY